MGWCEMLASNYKQGEIYFLRLQKESPWSKASNSYFASACCYHNKDFEQAAIILGHIPKLLEGQNQSELEKFILRRALRFLKAKANLDPSERLLFPAYELAFHWNGFLEMGAGCERVLSDLDSRKPDSLSQDDQAILLLLKAAAHRGLGNREKAKEMLGSLIDNYSAIKEEKYVMPFAKFELARLYLEEKNYHRAEELCKNSQKQHSGFDFETRLHFRISATLGYIHRSQKQ